MKFLISLILLCFTSVCSAETLQGIVTYVYDGDTIMLEADNRHYRIRLASIDAPELDQPYGMEAARLLRRLIYSQPVIAQVIDTDIYGRKIAKVYAPTTGATTGRSCPVGAGDFGRNQPFSPVPVAEVMLERGAAWHYGRYDMFDEEFDKHMKLEDKARYNKLGLWAEPHPVPPWMWRKR